MISQNIVPTALSQISSIPSGSYSSSLIQFNKKVFSWTDRVYITIFAPDFNSDPNIIDELGVT
ncbi:MAG: hypothetical protein WBV92_04470, partial [Nitrosotalea sp.]